MLNSAPCKGRIGRTDGWKVGHPGSKELPGNNKTETETEIGVTEKENWVCFY